MYQFWYCICILWVRKDVKWLKIFNCFYPQCNTLVLCVYHPEYQVQWRAAVLRRERRNFSADDVGYGWIEETGERGVVYCLRTEDESSSTWGREYNWLIRKNHAFDWQIYLDASYWFVGFRKHWISIGWFKQANRELQRDPSVEVERLQEELIACKMREAEANLSLKELTHNVHDLQRHYQVRVHLALSVCANYWYALYTSASLLVVIFFKLF